MKKYELVLMVDPSLKETDRKSLIKDLEKVLGSNILDTDDIGLQELVYDLGSKRGNNRAYFVSYYLQGDTTSLDEIRKALLYNKGILRYFLFSMTNTQPFHHFDKVTKELVKTIESWEGAKFGQKLTFFSDKRNA